MPINTIKCPHCGARVNHTVKLSRELEPVCNDVLKCPRCKEEFHVQREDIAPRTLSDTKELAEFTEKMEKTDSDFERFVADVGKEDTVEEALSKADEVFAAARGALDEISLENTANTIDAEELLTTFSVPDVKQFAMNKANNYAQQKLDDVTQRAQERFDLSDETAEAARNLLEEGFDDVYQKIANRSRRKMM